MVGANTVVNMSVKSLIGGIILFCGGLWAVLAFTIGGLRDDANALRLALDRTSDAVRIIEKEGIARTNDVNTKLSEQIQGLRVDFVGFGSNLQGLRADVVKFGSNLEQMSARIDQSNKSMENLSYRLEGFGSNLDNLSNRLDKFQAALVSASSPEIDQKRTDEFVESLKKAGIDKERIVIVPFSSVPPLAPPAR